jgi:amidase
MVDELLDLDATDQARAVASGDVTGAELVDASIRRLQAWNPTLNAVIHDRCDLALEEAAAATPGPFSGVPFVLKDLVAHSAGDPFHESLAGIRALNFTETSDTGLVARFRAAGLVLLGRTNTSELGLLPATEPVSYGSTRNPWALDRSPLGSSGGSAAAVAAGIVPVGHAVDGGGSNRLPASACGLVGLKPSRGRVSLGPDFGDLVSGTIAEFALTRSVRDSAALLDAVATRDFLGEPYASPHAGDSFGHAATRGTERTEPLGLRVGLMLSTPGDRSPVQPDCLDAVVAAGELLEDLGCRVQVDHPAALDEDVLAHAATIMPFGFAAFGLDWWERRTGHRLTADDVEPWTWFCAERGRQTTAPQYLAAVEWTQGWSRRVAEWWVDGYDLLVTPTVPEPPPPLGEFDQSDGWHRAAVRSGEIVSFTYPFNLTGQPAISLPLHHGSDGLPIGVQLIAPPGQERLLLFAAARLEAANPWSHRRPPTPPGTRSDADDRRDSSS